MNNAWLLRTNGSKQKVEPENGTDFSLEEVQRLLEADTVQLKECEKGMIMLMDEEGKFKHLVINYEATILLNDLLLPGDMVVGDVLYCESGMFK